SPVKLEVAELVDTDVKLLLQDEKDFTKKREIYGKIYQAKEANKVADKYLYTLTVVHPLFYLGLNQRYEIFQEKSAYAIIQEILGRYKALLHIDFGTNIAPHTFIQREYTTQYKQSDLEFIQMLCEQEGVSLWMQSDTTPYKVRLSHITESYTKLSTELRCSFTESKTFSPTASKEDYYDFRAPSKEYLTTTGATPLSQSLSDNTHSAQLRHDLEVMTHRDRLEPARPKDLQNTIKQTALKQYADTERVEGHTLSLYTETGYGGTLFDTQRVVRTEVVLTQVHLKGFFPNALEEYVQEEQNVQEYLFEVDFEATPKETVFIPHYNITKPLIPSSVTAIVSSGSKDTESTPNTIDVDSFGRIRVIFHFDPNYPTSCYIRFTNFSAGDGWGSQFIPRVNTEVIVNFLNGDPDRPVAIGSLYNGNNHIPKDLPSQKTQSYIKTQSMPGGPDNFNLLLFEDKGGNELVHMQAEKNHKLHAKNDSDNNIDHDERTTIGNDRTENVGHDETITIGNNRTEKVGVDEKISIGNDRTEDVGNNEKISIGNNRKESVGSNESVSIGKNQSLKVGKNQHEKVGMFKTETIGMAKALTVGLGYQVSVGAAKNETVALLSSEQVGMDKSSTVGKVYTLSAGDEIKLETGASSLTMKSDGTIVLKGVDISIIGDGEINVKAAKNIVMKGKKILEN
ncbi:MAG TPA: type VI secretion system tip protein VgrG, partial [Epsilonproteobacteria bacterium]|nr:type VI secretion system tip protein VgrG [Campylobacterota bacterium]